MKGSYLNDPCRNDRVEPDDRVDAEQLDGACPACGTYDCPWWHGESDDARCREMPAGWRSGGDDSWWGPSLLLPRLDEVISGGFKCDHGSAQAEVQWYTSAQAWRARVRFWSQDFGPRGEKDLSIFRHVDDACIEAEVGLEQTFIALAQHSLRVYAGAVLEAAEVGRRLLQFRDPGRDLADAKPHPKCEWCKHALAVHTEAWGHGRRYWCDSCVPMSGHYEFCGNECVELRDRKVYAEAAEVAARKAVK